ncbi:MAG: hypothetical protein AB1813_17505, partial [Verrucomicrobiota bacterium]
MKFLKSLTTGILIAHLGLSPLLAQPVLSPQNPFQPTVGSGITNLRVTKQSEDGTEALLTMEYTYDGFGGNTTQIVPLIGKKGQKGVSAWFGSDPVTVGRGRGIVTVKVRYFNDEFGVPPEFTSDRLEILLLNQAGNAIVSRVPFLKTIKWGSPNAKPAPPPSDAMLLVHGDNAASELAKQKEAEAKAREEARLKAEAE